MLLNIEEWKCSKIHFTFSELFKIFLSDLDNNAFNPYPSSQNLFIFLSLISVLSCIFLNLPDERQNISSRIKTRLMWHWMRVIKKIKSFSLKCLALFIYQQTKFILLKCSFNCIKDRIISLFKCWISETFPLSLAEFVQNSFSLGPERKYTIYKIIEQKLNIFWTLKLFLC